MYRSNRESSIINKILQQDANIAQHPTSHLSLYKVIRGAHTLALYQFPVRQSKCKSCIPLYKMESIVACTGCYQSVFLCSCSGPRRNHITMTRSEYERGLNQFYATRSTTTEDPNALCTLCQCFWCDLRAVCNPCVKCDQGYPCLFFTKGETSPPLYEEIDAPAEPEKEEPENLRSVEEKNQDENLYYIDVFERRVHDHKTMVSLKSRDSITVPSETSVHIRTNVVVGEKTLSRLEPSPYRSKMEVCPVDDQWWLAEPSRSKLLTKRGYVSPDFLGELHIQIFNRTSTPVIVQAGAPIGLLVLSCYEYYTTPSTVV